MQEVVRASISYSLSCDEVALHTNKRLNQRIRRVAALT